jgi:hypothetical protein
MVVAVFDMDNTLVDELGKSVRPGMAALLQRLRGDGVTLVLWTSSTRLRAREILSFHRLDAAFGRFVFREDYDRDNKGAGKDIRQVGGDILVDDDPKQVDFVRGLGLAAFLITTYRGGPVAEDGELDRLYRAVRRAGRRGLFAWLGRR